LFPPDSPNFQKIFQQHQLQPLAPPFNSKLPALNSKPPRHPPSKANRAGSDLIRRYNIGRENNPNYLVQRNMSGVADAKDPIAQRISPRSNKGQSTRLNDGDVVAKIPRKPKHNPSQDPKNTAQVTNEYSPNATNECTLTKNTTEGLHVDSPDKPTDSSPSEHDSKYFPETNTSDDAKQRLSAYQRLDLLKQRTLEWKQLATNSKKAKLEKLFVESKKNLFIAEVNFENVKSQNKRMWASAQQLSGKFDQIQEQLDATTQENVLLKKKLASAIKKSSSARSGNKHRLVENEVLLGILEAKAKTILWGHVKFIQSADEERDAARFLVKYGDIPSEYRQTKEMKADIVDMYSEKIKRAVFHKRNYTTAEIKKYYVKMWKAKKDTLTVPQLVVCLKREIKSEDDMSMFMLYWEEYLPKQVGASDWDKNVRYYNTISEATRPDCKSHTLHLVTPEDEAFLVLSIQNGISRWKMDYERAEKGLKKTKEEEKENGGLFTSTTSGQNQYGGWSEEGLELYQKYRDMNIAARKDPKCLEVEKDCLKRMRTKWGIECDTAVEHNKLLARKKSAKKRGRAEEPKPAMKKIIRTMRPLQDSDDEETEEDE
jgi:hypothetical protein